MNYDLLTAELTSDPAGIGYADMSDADAAAAIMASTQPARQLADRWRVKEAIYLAGRWPALVDLQASENADLATLARTAIAYLSDPDFERINLDYPMVETMLDMLMAVGLLTPELRAQIHAMGDTTTSRAAILGLPKMEPGHVASARQMMGGND